MPTESCSHFTEERPKSEFLTSDKPENHTREEKGEEKWRDRKWIKKSNDCTLISHIRYSGDSC